MSIRTCDVCDHMVIDNQVSYCPMCVLNNVAKCAERMLDAEHDCTAMGPSEEEDLAARDMMAALMPWQGIADPTPPKAGE